MTNLQRLGGAAFLGALLLLFGTATTVSAADGCLQMDGSLFVAKNFKIPSKNHCAPFSGFLYLSSSGEDAVDGSACTSATASNSTSRSRCCSTTATTSSSPTTS